MDRSVQDNFYLRLPSGPPTQADIWEGLPAWDDEDEHCTGILITPRCDIAHSKTPVINYLPIIPLKSYLLRFGGFALVEQEIDRTKTNLRNLARTLGILEYLNIGLPPAMLLDLIAQGRLATSEGRSAQVEKHIGDFSAHSERLSTASKLLEKSSVSDSDIAEFTNKRERDRLMRDVVKNAISDTFFLPPCTGIVESPSVALLRHIYTCRIEIFSNSSTRSLRSPSTERVNPQRLVRLKSPHIESLISRLAALFTRVGTRDIPSNLIDIFSDVG